MKYELLWKDKDIMLKDLENLYKSNELQRYKVVNDGASNILIKGDNIKALKAMQKDYQGKIKMIYIDPPYNTGKNFMYKDKYRKKGDKEKHSSWLNFMYPRLSLARDLLREDGVIFISINDNEQANLKLLCDEIFGEENFVSCCPVVSNRGGRDYGGIAITHEYILIYQKEFANENLNLLVEEEKKFQYKDKDGFFNLMELRNRNIKFNSKNRPNLHYPFYVDLSKIDENNLYDISLERKQDFVEVYPLKSQGVDTVWRWEKEKALKYLNLDIKAKKNEMEIL